MLSFKMGVVVEMLEVPKISLGGGPGVKKMGHMRVRKFGLEGLIPSSHNNQFL